MTLLFSQSPQAVASLCKSLWQILFSIDTYYNINRCVWLRALADPTSGYCQFEGLSDTVEGLTLLRTEVSWEHNPFKWKRTAFAT